VDERMSTSHDLPLEPLDLYDRGIAEGRYKDDVSQRRVLTELDRLQVALVASIPDGFFERVLARFAKPKQLQGIYLWGDVGRGKTLLMDLFFQSLPFPEKKRLHFHHFMQMVHQELNRLKQLADPMEHICEAFAKAHRVLCFDEFFVSDIGDAMLLQGLLQGLFERGVVLVTTSNVPPDLLYKDGLQRQRFLPAIALLQQHCQVLRLDAAQDYRLRTLRKAKIYCVGSDSALLDAQLEKLFNELKTADVELNVELDINDHVMKTRKFAGDLVWFDFDELCVKPRSAADYIELAHEFHTVMISNIPVFSDDNNDAARRFMFLVDEFYDRKVNVVVSAAAEPDRLYSGSRFEFEFKRTASRLIEMQSEAYLASGHKS
jgi:cell division protein ZapE